MAGSRKAAVGGNLSSRSGSGVIRAFNRRCTFLLAVSLAVLLSIAATAASAGLIIMEPGLFGTQELHSRNLQAFPKWRAVLVRFDQELADCVPEHCRREEWNLLLAELRGWSRPTQLMLVNRAMNRHRYREDAFNWDLADYWATPLQFLDRGGDCEDFAIAKYLTLRSVGVPAEDMRMVIVRDRTRRRMHAVLAVYVEGRAMILDNLRDDIVAASLIDEYEPIYSINERGWWLHRR